MLPDANGGEALLKPEDLRLVGIFSELSDAELRPIFRILQVKTFLAGSPIFHEGEAGDAVYFVSSGRVKISTTTADGKEKIIHFMQTGQVFGEVVLFESGPYPATATAAEDSAVGILRNRDLFSLLKENNDLAVSLLRLLSRRLRMAQSQLRDLALKDAFTRVGELVLQLAEQSGDFRPEGAHLLLSATREELANLAGTTRETFTRMLGELKREGLIRVVRGGLLIPDIGRLRDRLL